MYAVVRLNSFEANKLAGSADSLKQFDQAHAAQPGYVGSIVVDLQDGTGPQPPDVQTFRGHRHRTRDLRRLDPLRPLLIYSLPRKVAAPGEGCRCGTGPGQVRGQAANRARSSAMPLAPRPNEANTPSPQWSSRSAASAKSPSVRPGSSRRAKPMICSTV